MADPYERKITGLLRTSYLSHVFLAHPVLWLGGDMLARTPGERWEGRIMVCDSRFPLNDFGPQKSSSHERGMSSRTLIAALEETLSSGEIWQEIRREGQGRESGRACFDNGLTCLTYVWTTDGWSMDIPQSHRCGLTRLFDACLAVLSAAASPLSTLE